MFTANALWTLAYDTIYAMADKEDDLKIGIKNFGNHILAIMILLPLCFAIFGLPY